MRAVGCDADASHDARQHVLDEDIGQAVRVIGHEVGGIGEEHDEPAVAAHLSLGALDRASIRKGFVFGHIDALDRRRERRAILAGDNLSHVVIAGQQTDKLVGSRFVNSGRRGIIHRRDRCGFAVIDTAIVIQVEKDRDARQARFTRVTHGVGIFVEPLCPMNFTAQFQVSKINPIRRFARSDSEESWLKDELAVIRRNQHQSIGMNRELRQLLGH